MAAIRRLVLALGGVVALSGGAASLHAQITCTVSAAPAYVRYQGLTEQTGDVTLTCTGGTPTASGAQVPTANFAINIGSTNITSRLVGQNLPTANGAYPYTEALLAIDDPRPDQPNPGSAPVNLLSPLAHACPASNTGTCNNTGTNSGGGLGIDGNSYALPANYNVFQGYLFDSHTIRFDGVPFDAPGTQLTGGSLVVRMTNVRIDATKFASATLTGSPISALVSVTSGNSGQAVTIQNNGPTIVAYPQNAILFNGVPGTSSVCTPGTNFSVSVQEGFASAFKRQNVATTTDGETVPPPTNQNIFGYQYFTESGYYNPSLGANYAVAGQASQGTRFQVYLNNVPAGVTMFAPRIVYLDGGNTAPVDFPNNLITDPNGGHHSGIAHLVGSLDINGAGNYSQGNEPVDRTTGAPKGFIYEILYSDPSAIETAGVSFTVSYPSGKVQYTVPPTFANAIAGLAPFSPTPNNLASVVAQPLTGDNSIPRFAPNTGNGPVNVYSLTGCQCDLLFPYVVSQSGLETGIAIANTSADPYGTTPQAGYVQLFYYPDFSSTYDNGNQTPFSHTTATQINAGDQFLMVLGSGSANEGANVDGAPGFQGYIIAVAGFQYCHGYAFITDTEVQKWAQGYIALQLDHYQPLTFQFGGGNGPSIQNSPFFPSLELSPLRRGGSGGQVSAPGVGEILDN